MPREVSALVAGAGKIPEELPLQVAITSVTLRERPTGSSSSFDWLWWKRNKTSGKRAQWLLVALNGAVRYVVYWPRKR
jgi:hypothetical protein